MVANPGLPLHGPLRRAPARHKPLITRQRPAAMHSTLPIPWRRFLLEGTIIVLSILLAFWIDAWWQESEERKRELVVLQALSSDLERMRNAFDQQRSFNEAMLAATTELLDAGTAGEHDLGPDQVDALLGDIVWHNGPGVWQSAAMDMLVSAGDLAALSDMDLLRLLLPLHNRLESARGRYRLDENLYREDLIPFLGSHGNLPQILNGIDHAPGVPEWSYDFPDIRTGAPRDHRELLSNNEFQGLLAAKIDLQHDILKHTLEDLDEDLDEVISVLKVTLAD